MLRIAFDLELHNDGPSPENPRPECQEIIQLGYTIFNIHTQEIVYVGGDYITTGRPLSPYIQKLTGITEDDITNHGVSLKQAHDNMLDKFKELSFGEGGDVGFRQLITWGGGDLKELTSQLGNHSFGFGRNECNVKALYQAYMMQNKWNFSGGLKKSLSRLGMTFQPYVANGKQYGAHDARADSLNTARMYLKLMEKFKP